MGGLSQTSGWKRARRRAEAVLCAIGFAVSPKIPYPWLVGLSRVAGRLGYHLARKERRVALANLELAFGSALSTSARRRVARRSFQSFARTTLESLASERLLRDGLARRFAFEPGSLELLRELTRRGRGVIALTFHFGNWEWLSLAWGMAGFPLLGVSQPIKNPWVETRFRLHRERCGHRLIHRARAAPALYRELKKGGIIGLLADLNSSVEEGGRFFDFFGVPALTTRAVGFLAMRTGAAVVCTSAWPDECGRYRAAIGPEIAYDRCADPEAEGDRITRAWLAECERVVRRRPGAWMWSYKRWKTRPTPDPRGYPFYSFHEPGASRALARP
ncbi:MAG: lysophospholipid acyltransferase family protein [Verrucomicrobiae bacterium]|nr:lysophospholipid acyltransferase family protein [Verrucomicrobiae bacterium]